MLIKKPPLGYSHALTVNEAVTWMTGCEGQEQNFDEVLKQNELGIGAVMAILQSSVPPNEKQRELKRLRARSIELEQPRRQAMLWFTELNIAADELAQGKSHPTLVLCSTKYADGLPRFTIPSLHSWSVTTHSQEVPIWAAMSGQLPATAANSADLKANKSGPDSTALQQVIEKSIGVADKNLLVTTRIIAHALGAMVDKLAQDGHISHSAEEACIDDNDSVLWPALTIYVTDHLRTGKLEVPESQGQVTDTDAESPVYQEFVLAVLADCLAHLAETSRKQGWVTFTDTAGEPDSRTFLKNGHFAPRRIYGHLLRVGAIKEDTPNQGSSSIEHKLGHAKKRLMSTDVPAFNPALFQKALEFADQAYAEKFSLAPRRPAGLSG